MARTAPTTKTRVFISFDYGHDNDLKVLLLGQAKKHDTPFSFEDWSIKNETKGWKEDARKRIRRSDVVVVICGLRTQSAVGVAAEIKIAREEGVPFWLLRGRKKGACQRPCGTAWPWNPINDWTWEGIESMCRYAMMPWWKRIW
jgi:hypothetical protein